MLLPRLITCLACLLAAAALCPVFADWQTFDYRFIDQILKEHPSNHVEFNRIADTPVVYRAWGVWNFKHSAAEVGEVAIDFANFPKAFRYVYRVNRITEPARRIKPLGTWYVEGRAAMARVWAIGDIDTLCWTDSTHLRFIARQNEDKWLESKWSYQEAGWLNYRTHGVQLAAFIVGLGKDSCRVAIVAQGWVRKAMPDWLIKMAAAIILPQLLQDLDSEVSRRIEARKPNHPGWYENLINSVNQFLGW